jgi:ParB family chromosome partitioning protein
MEWARRLERIERVKAEERMKAGKTIDPTENSPGGETREIVAEKSGFGSREKY